MTNERSKIREKKEEMNGAAGEVGGARAYRCKTPGLIVWRQARSPAELKTDRMLDRLDRQLAMQEQAKHRGEFTWT